MRVWSCIAALLLAVVVCNATVSQSDTVAVKLPPCIDCAADTLILNGSDWSHLFKSLQQLTDTTDTAVNVVSIVHLGDSHVQAGFFTAPLRDSLQARWGDAGRGLLAPLRLCRTNEPTDYKITSNSKWQYSKCVGRKHRQNEPGVCGVAIVPIGRQMRIDIATLSRTGHCRPFSILRLFHSASSRFPLLHPTDSLDGLRILREQPGETRYEWNASASTCEVKLEGYRTQVADSCAIYGVSVENRCNGVLVHGIGNNGAYYDCYNHIPNFGQKVAALSPQLIILSMGTNESIGKADYATIYAAIDRLVATLRDAIPDALFLLTTPGENKLRRRRNRNGRRRTYYIENRNLPVVRNAIVTYGAEHGIAVWDWYVISGGHGSCEKLREAGCMSGDRTHYTKEGYSLQGTLLYKSIENAYERYMEQNNRQP